MVKEIQYLFPNAVIGKDIVFQDDGGGVYIKEWNLEAPQPTEAEISDTSLVIEEMEAKKEAEQAASKARDEAMLAGFAYGTNDDGTERRISVTKDDGDGMMQVEATFKRLREAIVKGELPPETEIKTVIHFKNGAKLPITEAEFSSFSLLFVIERGKFFS